MSDQDEVRPATIHITNLRLRTVIGIDDWERRSKQEVVINIALDFDCSKAVETDEISDTLDYKKLKKQIIQLVENSQFNLLERLTHEILRILMADPLTLAARVSVDKPHALRFADSVSVEMQMERQP